VLCLPDFAAVTVEQLFERFFDSSVVVGVDEFPRFGIE
jgi:hypothetical protein